MLNGPPQEALTFDDVLLEPAFSNILPTEVSVKTRITREMVGNIPLLSAAMDTVSPGARVDASWLA